MMNFKMADGHTQEELGLIPSFLSALDHRPAAEQFNDAYAHGGGWRPMSGWMNYYAQAEIGDVNLIIQYPDDEELKPIAWVLLNDEAVWVYPGAWVAIESADGKVEVSRMD